MPTTGIDLIWHTHMMLPEQYAKDTLALAGRVLDHSDTLNSATLSSSLEYPIHTLFFFTLTCLFLTVFIYTQFLWKKHYAEDYLKNKVTSPESHDSTTATTNTHVMAVS